MNKNQTIKRSTVTGRFTSKPLGKEKATKFAKVEGVILTQRSSKTISQFEGSGLKGDALRSAITGSFAKKRG
jgi:predicted deacylase